MILHIIIELAMLYVSIALLVSNHKDFKEDAR